MSKNEPDVISKLASLGSVTFVLATIAWNVVNAQWLHLGAYALLFASIILAVYLFCDIPGDDDVGPQGPDERHDNC